MKRFTFRRCLFVFAVVLAPSMVLAQPPGGPGGPGGPGFFGGPGGGGIQGLVMRDEVQEEIQLVDEQREKVRTIVEESGEKMRSEMRGLFEQMRDLSDDERRERFGEIREKMEAMRSEVDGQLKKALLPHQYERLKQIDFQSRLQQRGEGGMSVGAVADALELTDEQREKLEQRAEEVRNELREKVRQAQSEAIEKMLDVLTPDQQAKIKELMGDQFTLRDEGRFGGRGFRGRGERGDRERGDRGGERRGRRGGDRERDRGSDEGAI